MRIAVTGSSGLVGSALTEAITRAGHTSVKMVRSDRDFSLNSIFWDPQQGLLNNQDLNSVDAVVHLAGENIAGKKWNKAFKKKIRDSRIQSTTLLASSLAAMKNPPKVLISASAIGFYGDRSDQELTEESSIGEGFLPDLAKDWEDAAKVVTSNGVRLVTLRIGVVISKKGGALAKMLLPFKLGLGGPLGDGKHYVSWISLDDLISIILFCIDHPELSGPVNATAPNPVQNKEFTKALAKAVCRPAIFPLPKIIAKLIFGEMADEALFASAKIIPRKLLAAGFTFTHDTIDKAFKHELL